MNTYMKRLFLITILASLLTAITAITANADTSVASAKIYINPGHGSWGPDDRPMATIPYPNLSSTGRPDTCGFYESNTNLWKGQRLRMALIDLGCKPANIMMSRNYNGPYPYVAGASDAKKYNRNLSEICEEVDTWGADMFLSIHSDAMTDGSTTNKSLYIFRGKDNNNYVAGSQAMAQTLWKHAYVGVNEIDYASSTTTNIRGDIDFYGSSSTRYGSKGNYTGYLGVLKHGIPGFLAEGYCHTYQPARHRALNSDYCGQEGVRYSRGIAEYFGWNAYTKGFIMGFVKDKSKSVENSLYTPKEGTRAGDEFWPVMGARVYLNQNSTNIAQYTTDNNYNGVFVFERLNPGEYTLVIKASGYEDYITPVTVTANTTTYPKIFLTEGQGTNLDDPFPTPVEKIKGIFAYGLQLEKDENNSFTFKYYANSDAVSGQIIFTDSISGETIASFPLSNISEGENQVLITYEQLPEDLEPDRILNWSIELTGKPITSIVRLNDYDDTFNYTRASVTVDNSTESDYFGYVYVNDLKTRNASSSDENNRDNGIYRYNPLWQRENSAPYTGNMAWDNNFRISTDYLGRLYVPDFGDNHSGVFLAYPNKLGDTWQNFFAGSRTLNGSTAGLIVNNGVNTGSSSPAVNVCGTFENTKLYVSLEDFDYNIYCYDLGANMSDGELPVKWFTEPEMVHQKTRLQYTNTNVIAQADGAVWVSENLYTTAGKQSNLAAQPALRYITPAHDDYWSYATNSNTPVINLNGCAGGGFAISNDGTWLVIVDGDGTLQFFDINDTDRNKPILTWTKSFNADAKDSECTAVAGGRVPNGVYQMAFDRGGNLYVAGGKLGIYSIPTDNNTTCTPAKRSMTFTKGELTPPQPEPYEILKDIDTYTDTLNLSLTSKWVRSVKDEYANIEFEDNGIKNRGFTVAGDRVFITGRYENSDTTDIYLDVLDRNTGETIKRLDISDNAKCRFYPMNDVLTDKHGNLIISNLTIDVSTMPLNLFRIDSISGDATLIASLSAELPLRIDHCDIVGSIDDDTFTIIAPSANNNKILTWTISADTTICSIVEVNDYYPTGAKNFGLAPRITAMNDTTAWVSGSNIHPTLYNTANGIIVDSFASNADIQPAGLNANGFATLNIADNDIIIYPYDDFLSASGNRWAIATSSAGINIAEMQQAFIFPKQAIGKVHSQTWGAPVKVVANDDNVSADVFVYTPGAGIAAYTLKYTGAIYQKGDVNRDGTVNVGDVAEIYKIILGIDMTNAKYADLNDDKSINAGDISHLYQLILGKK